MYIASADAKYGKQADVVKVSIGCTLSFHAISHNIFTKPP